MVMIGPAMGVVMLPVGFTFAELQHPALTERAEWQTFKTATWWVFALSFAANIFGGTGLLLSQDWSAVVRAKAILWITGPFASAVLLIGIPAVVLGKVIVPAAIVGLANSTIPALIWSLYLSKSSRVRRTYKRSAQ
jgi:hypothetical protein